MAQDIILDNEEPSNNKETFLQQFCKSVQNSSGAALLEVIRQVLEAPNVFVFGELLVEPNIVALKDGPDAKYHNTLNLFAYGTYKEYRAKPDEYIELTAAMQKKLQHLTIVSLAIKTKSIPYAILLNELEIDNVRHLEDIIIEAIYADIIHGKLFQNTRILEVDYAQGRDIPPGYTGKIVETLQAWVNSCDGVSNGIDMQIKYANMEKAKRLSNKERIEFELISLKKVLRTQASDSDESMQIDTHGSGPSGSGGNLGSEIRKKPNKMKIPRSGPVGLKFSK
ncbi:COP9 signalosome complex subunit 7 [Drosophila tropicalis]|uniref:COP9 signalosome complex subunit 7 n=1 Tax=Drosophila tropicalis TaxID=46794 RepID=UPI0035AB8C3E